MDIDPLAYREFRDEIVQMHIAVAAVRGIDILPEHIDDFYLGSTPDTASVDWQNVLKIAQIICKICDVLSQGPCPIIENML